MPKPPNLRFRDRAAEQRTIDEANAHMESMFGDLRKDKGRPALSAPSYLPKKRIKRGAGDYRDAHDIDRVHAKQAVPLEQEVIRAIRALLAVHPRVVLAVRQNSGAASYEAKSGRYAPVKFYEIVKAPERVTVPDFWGLLRDGRMFACEAKRPGWTKPTDDREYKQAEFLAMVRNCGGIALFATSAEQVAEALR